MAVKWKWKPAAGGAVSPDLTNRVQTLENEVVKKTGDQSIAGNKTFTQPLTVATPTTNTNATTKEYVDNRIKKRVIDANIPRSNTYTIEPTPGYEIINVMVGRRRSAEGYYFFTYQNTLNFQLFLHTDGKYKIYTEGPVNGFGPEYKIIVVEMKV